MDSDLPHQKDANKPIEVAPPLSYVRIYSDPDGETHFSDEQLTFTLVDYAPPAPPISVSENLASESSTLISSPPGWYGDWHPVPQRQILCYLAGEIEAETSDGEVRRFGTGSVTLVEDVSGRGHCSRVIGTESVMAIVVQLEE